MKFVNLQDQFTQFHVYRFNLTRAGTQSHYMELLDSDGNINKPVKSINVVDKNFLKHPYWNRTVRISDKLVYLIGGSDTAKNFLQWPAKPPKASISLIGLGPIHSYIN